MLPPITPVVRMLLILNIGLFILDNMLGLDILALHLPGSSQFYPFQIITYMFMHGSISHLVFNMLALVMFGSLLERIWPPQRFLFFYLACGVGALICHLGISMWPLQNIESILQSFSASPNYDDFVRYFNRLDNYYSGISSDPAVIEMSNMLSRGDYSQVSQMTQQMGDLYQRLLDRSLVGASGSIYGLLVAFGLIMPEAEMMLIFLPIPIKAKYFIPILIGIELLLGMGNLHGDNVAHFAHLGGALFGALILLWWWRKR